jgi:multidrug efflux pump subunit AcrB
LQGAVVRVKDIASVERGYETDSSYIENSGNPALVLSISMRSGSNIVSFGKEINKIINEFKNSVPKDIEIFTVADAPEVVANSINHFFRDFAIAVISVIIVIMIFLPARVAAVAAVTIPVSIFASMGILEGLKIELNTVSLASLVLVLGMIVDNSIILIDNYVEKLDSGFDSMTAAYMSAKELIAPVTSATLAIIAAFAPTTMFMTGMFKEFIDPVPTTVTITLFISLLIAAFFVPILSQSFIKKGISSPKSAPDKKSALERLQDFYNSRIEFMVNNPVKTIITAFACAVAGAALALCIPQEIFPKLDRNQFAVEIYFPEGTSLSKNASITKEMSDILSKDKRVKNVVSFIGTSSPRFNTLYAPQIPAKNYSQLIVITGSDKTAKEILEEYSPKYSDAFAGAHLKWKELDFLPAAAPIEIRISGGDITQIKKYAASVKELMSQEPDITWIRDDFRDYRASVDLDIDKEAANRLAVTRAAFGLAMALNDGNIPVASVWEDDYAKPVILKYSSDRISNPGDVLNLYMPSILFPKPIMAGQMAKAAVGFSEGQIVRRNGTYCLTVSGDTAFGKLSDPVFNRLRSKIEKLPKPDGITLDYGGEREMIVETYVPFGKSLAVSVVMIFLILFFQFKSAKIVFLVMSVMPLGLIGGALGLILIGYPFGMTSFIGFIGLFGIVVRNGVILISYALELEAQGMSRRDAAIAAGKRRMRPIFLTASAAAVGVIPLITSGSLLWGPLGTVICFGLISATALTLYALPAAYLKFAPEIKKDGL